MKFVAASRALTSASMSSSSSLLLLLLLLLSLLLGSATPGNVNPSSENELLSLTSSLSSIAANGDNTNNNNNRKLNHHHHNNNRHSPVSAQNSNRPQMSTTSQKQQQQHRNHNKQGHSAADAAASASSLRVPPLPQQQQHKADGTAAAVAAAITEEALVLPTTTNSITSSTSSTIGSIQVASKVQQLELEECIDNDGNELGYVVVTSVLGMDHDDNNQDRLGYHVYKHLDGTPKVDFKMNSSQQISIQKMCGNIYTTCFQFGAYDVRKGTSSTATNVYGFSDATLIVSYVSSPNENNSGNMMDLFTIRNGIVHCSQEMKCFNPITEGWDIQGDSYPFLLADKDAQWGSTLSCFT